ncbi:16S rRNA (guanine(527)-N(7))-methyltransferase [hydrothermal vent metagenome]|uniref:16S rRNA (Guanine(527)-N(7))-methyltransferase n=1 Tax=hydrothermal vent metagenome TaxID=652676 RepID=A0A3B0Z3U3_9ZZZZ
MSLKEQLSRGCEQLSIPVSEAQLEALLHYQEMLLKWNKVYNLTAITAPPKIITHHLLDSLAVLPYLQGDHIIDVGCGGGLPGIILAIMLPEKQFVLLDSNSKKTRFVKQVVIELRLKNVAVEHSRVEKYQPEHPFDVVLSRAFASLSDMLVWCAHLRNKSGIFLAMKGVNPQEEHEPLPDGFRIFEQHQLIVPGLNAERHVVLIDSQDSNEQS